jgi:hypothetical protein
MFAPKVVKAQTKAADSPVGKPLPHRSAHAARPFGDDVAQQPLMRQVLQSRFHGEFLFVSDE